MKRFVIFGNLGNRITMYKNVMKERAMPFMKITRLIIAGVLFAATAHAEAINGLWERSEVMQAPTIVWGATVDKPLCVIKSLTFTGLPYKGSANTYSAYLAVPKNISGKAPGVVLIHGGAGAAFSNWAEQWANKGYVAIAPDFNFKMTTDSIFMKRNCGTLKDMWTYHSVAAVMRAVSVVSSQPETDPEKIAMMGISWGGYLTCIASAIDTRVKVAIPVYGCGFYDSAESPGAGWHGALTDLVLNHLEQIINCAGNPVTNASAEGINSIVMTLQRAARGYRTWKTFRMAILFYCGGLELYPNRRITPCR